MCAGVRAREIVAIVRSYERDICFARETDKLAVDVLLDFEALILHFQKEISVAENVAEARCARTCLLVLAVDKRVGHFTTQAGGQCDQPLVALREKIVVHAGLVIKAVEEAGGNEPNQIAVALIGFGEKDKMVRAGGFRPTVLVAIGRDVHLTSDDGLHAMGHSLIGKVYSTKKIAMIRDGDGGHPQTGHLSGEVVDLASAIEE